MYSLDTKHLLVLGMYVFFNVFLLLLVFYRSKHVFYNILYSVYYYDYLYVFYRLDIGERSIELMFSVYCHTDENKDHLSIYLSIYTVSSTVYCHDM